MSWRTIWKLLRETLEECNRDKISQMAAALAYYTVFSIAPLLIIVIAIAGFAFGEEAAQGEIVGQIRDIVGQEGAEVIQITLENAYRPGTNTGLVASLISFSILIFGASGVFVQLQEALNAIWNLPPQTGNQVKTMVRKRAMSFVIVLGIGFLLLVSLLISALLAGLHYFATSIFPGLDQLWQFLNFAVAFSITTGLFALMFKYLPDTEIAWNDVKIGAVITSLLFSIGRFLIGLYLGNSSFGSSYGAAGSFVVFLAWIYYSVHILFFGAEFTQVYARRYGSHRVR